MIIVVFGHRRQQENFTEGTIHNWIAAELAVKCVFKNIVPRRNREIS